MERLDRYLIGIVLAHFVVVMVHSVSHFALGILPAAVDAGFIIVVFIGGPLILLPVLRVNRLFAVGLLATLMGAALAYGFNSHFVASGPDHVSLVVSDPWTAVFVGTAAVLGVLEIASMVLAVAVLRAAAKTPSAPAGPRA